MFFTISLVVSQSFVRATKGHKNVPKANPLLMELKLDYDGF